MTLNVSDLLRPFWVFTEQLALLSPCKRHGVGCILIDENFRIRGWGYNRPRGYKTCSGEVGNCGCSHAEWFACFTKDNEFNLPLLCLITLSPCQECLERLISANVKAVLCLKVSRHGIIDNPNCPVEKWNAAFPERWNPNYDIFGITEFK
ncbi:hypothetical protein C4588_01015 [Candidatus Parcubacteria bacterium]|nr:MAG: hypothetical protein C4588_01015 [Candidatus Parcubacteria bacterium]